MKIAVLALLVACGEPGDLPPSELRDLNSPLPVEIAAPASPAPPEEPEEPRPPSFDWIEADPIEPCPEDEWGDIPKSGVVVYVKAGAAGDGSRGHPFGRFKDATEAVRGLERATIAIGRGTYRETIGVRDGVSIVGVCPAETILLPEDGLVFVALGWNTSISRVTIRGDSLLLANIDPVSLVLDRVVIESFELAWETEPRTHLTLRRSVVRDGVAALGIRGEAEIDQVIFVRNSFGVLATDRGARAMVSRSRFEDLREHFDAELGWVSPGAVSALEGAFVAVRSSRFEGMTFAGVADFEASLEMHDVDIHRAEAALTLGHGSKVLLSRAVLGSVEVAAIVDDSEMRVEDATVSGSGAFFAINQGALEAARVRMVDPLQNGMFSTTGGSIVASDLIVEGGAASPWPALLTTRGSALSATRVRSTGPGAGAAAAFGSLIQVYDATIDGGALVVFGSSADLQRLHLAHYGRSALRIDDSDATASDLRIESALAPLEPDPLFGIAVAITGSEVQLARIAADRARGFAIGLGDSNSTVTDLVVKSVQTGERNEYGSGVFVVGGTTRFERMEIVETHTHGFEAYTAAEVIAHDVRITDSRSSDCTELVCAYQADSVGGIGLSARYGAHVSLSRFEIRTSALAGVQALGDATIELRSGVLAENEIGIHRRLDGTITAHEVSFADNGSNVEASGDVVLPELALPEVLVPQEPEIERPR